MTSFSAFLQLALILVIFTERRHCSPGVGYEWTYEGEHGPREWPEHFSKCKGKHQSPINIVERLVEYTQFEPLEFVNIDQPPTELEFTNNKHTASASMKWKQAPLVRGGFLNTTYQLINFHFHWGPTSFTGSEHTIDGEHYPMEMHLVWRNTKYDNISEALSHEDGLAVFGVMFEVSDYNGKFLAPFESALSKIVPGDSSAVVSSPPDVRHLLPDYVDSYYRYSGSLTTPTCDEAVTWTIFDHTVKVTEKQLNLLRTLETSQKHHLEHNYRPVQDRHERVVYHSGVGPHSASGPAVSLSKHQQLLQLTATAVTAANVIKPLLC